MDAHQLLDHLTEHLEEHWSHPSIFRSSKPWATPRHVGAFGTELTDCITQAVVLNGEKFFLSVEKDPNQ